MSDRLFGRHERIGFFGIGKSNLSLMRLLPRGVEVILRSDGKIDRGVIPSGLNVIKIFEGRDSLSEITEQVLYLSPSVRRERRELTAARASGVVLSSELEEFFKENRAPVFGVSGSDGKSTTTYIASKLLRGRFSSPLPVGNFGTPAYENIGLSDAFVAELSSFTLRYLEPPLLRGVLTNITPNHLNWHESFSEYVDAKLALFSRCDECVVTLDGGILSDYARAHRLYAVVGEDFGEIRKKYRAEVYITLEDGFIKRCGERLLGVDEIRHLSRHNVKNLMSAIALTDGYSSIEEIEICAREFSGLAHRSELVGRFMGVDYVDSSIDSTPLRTAATLSALDRPVILILGGRSKGSDYSTLLPLLKKYAKKCIIYGESRETIYRDIKDFPEAILVPSFDAAVSYAIDSSEIRDTVLLSPAATSYDSFSSFEERGKRFAELIKIHYNSKNTEQK